MLARPALVYAVRRGQPELVVPAAETPRETKALSDLDNLLIMRTHVSVALFYRGRNDGVDPAGIIRTALREALVHYYPLAGRLRETDQGERLAVDCTGEGVLFVQADADVRLAELGLTPPFPCWDQLLSDVEGSSGMLHCPLLLIQVTRLLCGGFVFALRFNHAICDGKGVVQFANAVCELARGAPCLSVMPVWSRELVVARHAHPPTPTPRPSTSASKLLPPPGDDMVVRSFTFGAADVAAMKKSLPRGSGTTPATTFEVLAAFLWRARTAALQVAPGEDAALLFPVSFRGGPGPNRRLPKGYYGNAIVPTPVVVDAAALLGGSLGDAVALVRTHKATADADELVLAGGGLGLDLPANVFMVSDTTRLGSYGLDMGWGEPVFAGPAQPVIGASFLIDVKDGDGEHAVCVPVMLPRLAMQRFAAEVDTLLLGLKQSNH